MFVYRRVAVLVLFLVAVCIPGAPPVHGGVPRRPTRLVVISWDGAPDWVIDRLLAQDKLPNLGRMAKSGVRADYVTPAYPSKTACGHAAIWTGAFGDVNGIVGNSVPLEPKAGHSLLESGSGFDSSALKAEPLWITAVRAGRRAVTVSATQSDPPARDLRFVSEHGVSPDRLVTLNGFDSEIAPARLLTGDGLRKATGWAALPAHNGPTLEFESEVAGTPYFFLVFDDPGDSHAGFDSILIRQGSKDLAGKSTSDTIKPRFAARELDAYSRAFRVESKGLSGRLYFRLFNLNPETGRCELYQRAVSGLRGTATPATIGDYLDEVGGYHDDVFFNLYERGDFGAPLWAGGSGEAEKRAVETVRFDVELLKRSVRYAIAKHDPDLLIHYTPMIDSAGHIWVGAIDPGSPTYNPSTADLYWGYYEEVIRLQDEWLGEVMRAAGSDAVVCLVSDHGMQGTMQYFNPNAALAAAGLYVMRDGTVDLAKTKALVPPWGDFSVYVNTAERRSGIVDGASREAVEEQVRNALLRATDPATGNPIVQSVYIARSVAGYGFNESIGGDVYFDLVPGYYPSTKAGAPIVRPARRPIGSGDHGFAPHNRKMHAICYISGPGVAQGKTIAGIRQIDIAPTLCWIVGLPAPANATGRVIFEATASPWAN